MSMEDFQERGGPARAALGIDGTAGDAQDVPHGFDEDLPTGACVVCGLSETAKVHRPGQEPATPGNCWVLTDPDGHDFDGGDHVDHYATWAEAEKAADHGHKIRQLDNPCQTITCVCCEITYDEDGEGYTVHFDDPETIPLTGWKPEGDGYRCDVCVAGPCDVEAGNHG